MTKVMCSTIKKKNCDIEESVEEPISKNKQSTMQSTDTPLYVVTTLRDATISYGNKVSGEEAQDMPLTPTQQDIDWQTGIRKLKFPSNWSYTKENDEFNIFKVLKDKGSLEVEKSLVLCKGIVSYQVKKSIVPQNIVLLPSLLTSLTVLENIIKVFDELEVCGGVTVSHVNSKNVLQKLQQVEFNEGYEDSGVWRSYSCKRLLQPPSSKFPNARKYTACKDCRNFKITLQKKIWNLNQLT
ncbi:hypothetical protein OUZ56_010819 [Daphnia magna]|uniref:Uncharacterized protein n=1 Tax=Daphnia magna TaxID=35525 RepID=A0ABQ9YYL3_9CRUS|nr:hypothetical protein OUZ56_010819 [Daphnia magna]